MVTTSEETVEVPRRLLEELLSYLPNIAEGVEVPGGNGVWTASMVEALHPEVERLPAAKAVLDEAAKHPGTLVSLLDVVRSSGIQRGEERERDPYKADLGSLSKISRRLFGRKTWPMTATQAGDGMFYVMPPKVSEWWNAGADR